MIRDDGTANTTEIIHAAAIVRSLPNKAVWLRRIITEAAQRELMGGDES
jgi:hypothetical protein